jgi:hypothetical protein
MTAIQLIIPTKSKSLPHTDIAITPEVEQLIEQGAVIVYSHAH